MGRHVLQPERNAALLIDVLRSLVVEAKFELHDFVVMPDHLHLLMTMGDGMTVEKAMQLVKGGFSFRAKKAFDWKFEIWQQGFSDHRIRDEEDWVRHLGYIRANPVKAGLAAKDEEYPYLVVSKPDFPQGLKPQGL